MKRLFCAGMLGAGLTLAATTLVQAQVQDNVTSPADRIRNVDLSDDNGFNPGLLGLAGLLGLGGLAGLNKNRDETRGMKSTPADQAHRQAS